MQKPQDKSVIINARVTEEMASRLAKRAEKEDRSKSSLVRLALEKYLRDAA